MALTSDARLARLLESLFDSDALRRFLRSSDVFDQLESTLPGINVSGADLADAVVRQLQQRGLIAPLFPALLEERPHRAAEIEQIANLYGVSPTPVIHADKVLGIEGLHRSIGIIRVDDEHGCTAFLVGPDLAITSSQAIDRMPTGFPFILEFPDAPTVAARIGARSPDGDCAVIHLTPPLRDRAPLRIAARCATRSAAWGVGYSRARRGWTVSLDGMLVLPGEPAPSVTVFSDVLSVHMDAVHHCLSGAPVIVDDHVVGLLSSRIERDGEPGRSLSGLVRLCPSAKILELLARAADRDVVGHDPGPLAPDVKVGEYHTVVTFASSELGWARALEERLALEGFRAYLAEPGLPDGRQHQRVADVLSRCRSGLVILTRSWQESRACAAIGQLLVQRRQADPDFRLIVLRLDSAMLAAPWSSCLGLDFRDPRGPSGPRWAALVHALVWADPPSPTTQRGACETATATATDTMLTDLWAAAQIGPLDVIDLWRGWRSAGALPLAPSLQAAAYLISQSRAGLALEVLESAGSETRADQLRALALARTGDQDGAIRLLERLHRGGALDSETTGLLAGRYKRVWEATDDRRWLQKALALYTDAYERSGESYPGINAAALSLYFGHHERSRQLAREVRVALEARPEAEHDHWKLATLGEACHLLGDHEHARRWYDEAVKAAPMFHGDIATMRAQVLRNARYLGQPEDSIGDLLAVPRVVAFVGHMEDLPGRPVPRFPPHLVPRVRAAIRERLRDLNAGFGFSSLARGADILFVEEMLGRRAPVRVLLPFPAEHFEQTSVGPRWSRRFRDLVVDPRIEVDTLTATMPVGDVSQLYADCSERVFQRAIESAEQLRERPVLLAVWDGNPGDGPGGTANDIAFWEQSGHELVVIDLRML